MQADPLTRNANPTIFENVYTRVTWDDGAKVFFVYTLNRKGMPSYVTYTHHRVSAKETAIAITGAIRDAIDDLMDANDPTK